MIQTSALLDLEQAKAWLSQQLTAERFEHSLGAMDKAAELAEKFQLLPAEKEQALLAGLLHDAAKTIPASELIDYCQQHELPLEETDRQAPQTLHPFVGAHMVHEALKLGQPDLLNAIRYHTTGRAGMSRVEKIVYIADKIEGNTRNPLYVQKVTGSLDFRNPHSLDLTMLYILDSTIQFLIEKHQTIHPRTIEARNDFVLKLRTKNQL